MAAISLCYSKGQGHSLMTLIYANAQAQLRVVFFIVVLVWKMPVLTHTALRKLVSVTFIDAWQCHIIALLTGYG